MAYYFTSSKLGLFFLALITKHPEIKSIKNQMFLRNSEGLFGMDCASEI